MYNHPIACVKVNNNVTDWFNISSRVRQAHSLPPTLFGLYINDLITDVKDLNLGINVNDIIISILAFADDIVILAKNEKDLQDILNCVENWCNKWRLKVNADKNNVVHFRGKRKACTKFNFKFDHNELKIVDRYKYLGIILQENLDYNVTRSVLARAVGRALGAVISKFK